MRTLLITGGAGFIGSNFIRFLLNNSDYFVINYDLLTYSGNLENLKEVQTNNRYSFFNGDICDKNKLSELFNSNKIDGIINFAAESHVDRSILDSQPFVHSNINGVVALMDIARQFGVHRFLQISTDEVYGSARPDETFYENSNLVPNSPYSASKAAADLLVHSYIQTHNFPAIITRSSNNFGPYQYPEKFIPLIINNALQNKRIPVYGDGLNVRDWIFVEDNCRALFEVFEKGKIGEIYNIAANNEKTNLDIVHTILNLLNKSTELIEFVKDRPAHDRRYSINADKVRSQIGWYVERNFEESLVLTINWYMQNKSWLESITNKTKFADYYKIQYGLA